MSAVSGPVIDPVVNPVVNPVSSAAVHELEEELRTMVRTVKKVVAARAAEVHPELQPASYSVLSWLLEHGPARGSLLARGLEIDKASASRHLQHLVELGLVERTPDPDDRRAQLLAVTPAAATRMAATDRERRAAWARVLEEWSTEDVHNLTRLLGRLNETLR